MNKIYTKDELTNAATVYNHDIELDPENIELNLVVNQHTAPRARALRQADRSHHETTVRSRIIWLLLWLILAIGYWCMGNNGLLTGTQSTVLTLICSGAALRHFWKLAQSVKPNT